MVKPTIIFYGFIENTDKQDSTTIICKDLGEAHGLFNQAIKEEKWDYIDITLTDPKIHEVKLVRKYSKN